MAVALRLAEHLDAAPIELGQTGLGSALLSGQMHLAAFEKEAVVHSASGELANVTYLLRPNAESWDAIELATEIVNVAKQKAKI